VEQLPQLARAKHFPPPLLLAYGSILLVGRDCLQKEREREALPVELASLEDAKNWRQRFLALLVSFWPDKLFVEILFFILYFACCSIEYVEYVNNKTS